MKTARKSCALALVVAFVAALAWPAAAGSITIMVPAVNVNPEWEAALARFVEVTGVEVEVIVATTWDDMMAKVPTMVAGGLTLDAIYHDNAVQSDLISKDVMRPIEDLVVRDGIDLSIWPAPVVRALRYLPQYTGQLYSLPTGVSLYATYYNPDRFSEAGLGTLTRDWASDEFTWDEMVEIARNLTVDRNGDGQPEQFGLQDFMSFGAQAVFLWDLHWIDPEQTRFIGNTPQHIEALNQVRYLYELNVIGGNFLNGTAGMVPRQAVYLNELRNAMQRGNAAPWLVAPNPLAVCRCSFSGFHSWGMPRSVQNIEDAWRFIRFMTLDPEGAILFNRAENRVPVLPDTVAEFVERWDAVNPGWGPEILIRGLEYARKSNWGGLPRNIFTTIRDATTRVMRGQVDAGIALAELETVINGIIADARK